MSKNLLVSALLTYAAMAVVCCNEIQQPRTAGNPDAKPATANPGSGSAAAANPAAPAAPMTPPAVAQTKPAAPMVASSKPAVIKGLKDAYAGKFLIGTAADPGGYSEAEQQNIKDNYNVITPENCMKPQPIHPQENQYNWAQPDTLVQFGADNNIKIFGHNLCWHSQVGQWFFQGTNGGQATKEQMLDRLHQHIATVVGRYKGKIIGWDVVNEAINDGGGGLGGAENLRRSNWSTISGGDDFILDAFKWAHEADPNAFLNYNDYNIEQGARTNSGKHASSMALLKKLKDQGIPIDGVGIQGHWSLTTNMQDIEKSIEDYASLGLKVSITELDVTAQGGNSGALGGGGGARGTAGGDAFQRQAQWYAQLFQILLKHQKDIARVTFWGTNDRRSWKANQQPLLFDAQMNPKPAYQAVMDVGLGKYDGPGAQ